MRPSESGARVGPRILMAGPYLESASNVERMRGEDPALVTHRSALVPFDTMAAIVGDTAGTIDARSRYVSRYLRLDWREQLAEHEEADPAFWRELFRIQAGYAREMHRAGVPVFPGTDGAVILVYPGFSLHDELEIFVDSLGFTPEKALAAATRRSAEFLDRVEEAPDQTIDAWNEQAR